MTTATETRDELAARLEEALPQFIGSEHYYLHSILYRHMLHTDGVHYLIEEAGAYWLLDLIASHQNNPRIPDHDWQVWNLEVDRTPAAPYMARVYCGDGNGTWARMQRIEHTDFPLAEITIWLLASDKYQIAMLPSEY
jgi:hypothetical protein